MMKHEDICFLDSAEGRAAVEGNLGRDPFGIALDKKLPEAALVASQVKYLQRARRKLPSYYNARCIIPPLAFEQSSSEETAAVKKYSGRLCIDLTCGLGADSLNFSRMFDRVVSVEKDGVLAQAAAINFGRLGAVNIEVVHSAAEDFIKDYNGAKADLIYLDPDRRPGSGQRRAGLQDCAPDAVSLMPAMLEKAHAVLIKASPLFDVDEAFRLFPLSRVTAVSAGGECKEVLIEVGGGIKSPETGVAVAGKGSVHYPCPVRGTDTVPFAPPYDHMIIPDVALRKARLTAKYFGEILPGAYAAPGDGYVFASGETLRDSPVRPEEIYGKVFEVVWMRPFHPKTLRAELAGQGVKGADIYLHDFPLTAGQICRELKIKEGGPARIAFTRMAGGLWSIGLKEVNLHGY